MPLIGQPGNPNALTSRFKRTSACSSVSLPSRFPPGVKKISLPFERATRVLRSFTRISAILSMKLISTATVENTGQSAIPRHNVRAICQEFAVLGSRTVGKEAGMSSAGLGPRSEWGWGWVCLLIDALLLRDEVNRMHNFSESQRLLLHIKTLSPHIKILLGDVGFANRSC